MIFMPITIPNNSITDMIGFAFGATLPFMGIIIYFVYKEEVARKKFEEKERARKAKYTESAKHETKT